MLSLSILACQARLNFRQNYAKILPMKLPTPRKRGDAYRIEIMIDGQRMSATRDTIKECHAWASRKLLESKAGQLSTADTRSQLKLGELMTIQYESSRRQSKGKRTDLDYQRMITRDYAWLTSMRVVDITAQDLTRYRDMRLQKVAPSTVLRELLACLSSFDKHDKSDSLIEIDLEAFRSAWRRAVAETGIKNLQFRDTRHEAISRFVKTQKLPVELVAKITGHKKIETLLNVYYNPTADELYDAMYGDK